MKSHRFWFAVFAIAVAAGFFVHTKEEASSASEELGTKILRFHVIAESDSESDQTQKLKVKEAVLQMLSPYLTNAKTKENAKEIIQDHMEEVLQTSRQTLDGFQNDVLVTAELTTCYFPTKTYGSLTFPPGEYEALVIRIGDAKGKNWWCVMYPPLCFVDVSYGTVPKESDENLQHLLSKDTYESLTSKEKPLKTGFKLFSFLNRFLSPQATQN